MSQNNQKKRRLTLVKDKLESQSNAILTNLYEACDGTSKDVTECNTKRTFLHSVIYNLNMFTKPWNLNWWFDIEKNNFFFNDMNEMVSDEPLICVFKSKVEWPMSSVIPLDLMSKLRELIAILGGRHCSSIVFDYAPEENDQGYEENIVSFRCICAFYEDGYYVKCGNCGNRWDGNAQCTCSTDI